MKTITAYTIIIGAWIKYNRQKHELGQAEFANKIDSSQAMVSKMEQGKMVLNVLQLKAIWEYFEISPEHFFEDVDLVIKTLEDSGIDITNTIPESSPKRILRTEQVLGIIHLIGHF